MHSLATPALPIEIILLIATYLAPLDQQSLLQAIPRIAGLFSFRQFASTDDDGDTILHLQARARTSTAEPAEKGSKNPVFPSILNTSNGAILHPRNQFGAIPLMHAAYAGNLQFMQLLLEKDPDSLNMVDEAGATALWYALYTENAPAVALLLLHPSINVNHRRTFDRDHPGYQKTPLIYAIHYGRGSYDVVSLLVKHPDTDLMCVDEDGNTPLNLAIREKREDIVRDMLKRGGLDINAALHTAAQSSCVGIIDLLLAQDGIDANHPTSRGETPLMRARYYLSMEALLAHPDVKVDHVDHFGRSALSYAAERGDLSCAVVLLKHGARPDLKDSWGETPISRAAMAKQGDMVKLLETAIAAN